MIRTLEHIEADPYTRRIKEEQEFDELEMKLLSNTITKQLNTIASLQSNNASLQSQIDAYIRRYGNLN